jgi:hypothetical protein
MAAAALHLALPRRMARRMGNIEVAMIKGDR